MGQFGHQFKRITLQQAIFQLGQRDIIFPYKAALQQLFFLLFAKGQGAVAGGTLFFGHLGHLLCCVFYTPVKSKLGVYSSLAELRSC